MKNMLFASAILFGLVFLSGNAQRVSHGYEMIAKGQEERKAVEQQSMPLDINGKPIKKGEQYLAELTFPDGKKVAYRKNKKEVEALVKALRENGVTDRRLLDSATWMGIGCSIVNGKCGGFCDTAHKIGCSYQELIAYKVAKTRDIALPYKICACLQ